MELFQENCYFKISIICSIQKTYQVIMTYVIVIPTIVVHVTETVIKCDYCALLIKLIDILEKLIFLNYFAEILRIFKN